MGKSNEKDVMGWDEFYDCFKDPLLPELFSEESDRILQAEMAQEIS